MFAPIGIYLSLFIKPLVLLQVYFLYEQSSTLTLDDCAEVSSALWDASTNGLVLEFNLELRSLTWKPFAVKIVLKKDSTEWSPLG